MIASKPVDAPRCWRRITRSHTHVHRGIRCAAKITQRHVRFRVLLLAFPPEELLERLPLCRQLCQTVRMDHRWERVGVEREPERLVLVRVRSYPHREGDMPGEVGADWVAVHRKRDSSECRVDEATTEFSWCGCE